MTYFYIKLNNGVAYERSVGFESETLPEVVNGWDAVWTLNEWNDYVASIPAPTAPTEDSAASLADFMSLIPSSYQYFRYKLIEFVNASGTEESVFDAATIEEKIFLALNGVGTVAQIANTLSEPTKETINYLTNLNSLQ